MIEADFLVTILASQPDDDLQLILLGINDNLISTIVISNKIEIIVHPGNFPLQDAMDITQAIYGVSSEQSFFSKVEGIVPVVVRQANGEQD